MLAHVKNMGHKIKEILINNCAYFDNREMEAVLLEEEITKCPTASFTSQQNQTSK